MAEEIYTDPILKKYAELIKTYTQQFKRIYFGDPIRIGVSELPALILAKTSSSVLNYSNMQDEHSIRITFTVVSDVRETINDDKTMVRGVSQLYDLVEGRQADYSLKTSSLLGILRQNVEVDTKNNLRTDLKTATAVNYGMTIDKRQANAWALEATVDISAHFIQNR